MNDKRPKAAADEADPRTDPLDMAIVEALADRALPLLPDDLAADAASMALTPADRQALDALGSSQALVNQVIASVDADEPTSGAPCDEATLRADDDVTVPLPGSPFCAGEAPDLDYLLERLDAIQTATRISWPSSYLKLRELGRGGQGVVYLTKCLDALCGEQAMKIYSPLPYGSATAYREDMQRMFQVAMLVNRLRHDNLVNVQRFVDYQGIYLMVMHWIDGYDLRRLVDLQLLSKLRQSVDSERWADLDDVIYASPFPGRLCLQPLLAVNIVEKCLRGLSALHDKGIVHGDIKPSNIMLDCNGSIRLIDIGSAFSSEAPPRSRTWTPHYAPPEFLERGEWTRKSDLASLGYVLIELLSGRPNVVGRDMGDESTRTADRQRDGVLLEAKRCLPQRLPDLMPENVGRCDKLMRLCQKLIDPDPKKRFADANEAIDMDDDGTWHFRMELVRGDLAVSEASAIKNWIDGVKNVDDLQSRFR